VGKVVAEISMSLDGYVAGPNPSLEKPLGEGGDQLPSAPNPLNSWREPTASRLPQDRALAAQLNFQFVSLEMPRVRSGSPSRPRESAQNDRFAGVPAKIGSPSGIASTNVGTCRGLSGIPNAAEPLQPG
jgi:hypothetical protein